MKSSEIVNILQERMPRLTDYFSNTGLTISNMVLSEVGDTYVVTVTTSEAHELTTGCKVFFEDVFSKNELTSLTRVDSVATAVTTTDHDLTEDWQDYVIITGANESDYNGTKTLLSVEDDNTFTFTVANEPDTPSTGTIYLLEDRLYEYYELHEITKVDATSFTFVLGCKPSERVMNDPYFTNATLHSEIRIKSMTGNSPEQITDTIERSYTSQGYNDLWMFVGTGNLQANKSRGQQIDSYDAQFGQQQDYRQSVYQTLTVVVVSRVVNQEASDNKDLMEDMREFIFRSLLGYEVDSGLTTETLGGLTFINDGIFDFNDVVYSHFFEFEVMTQISLGDTSIPDRNVAFRKFTYNYKRADDYVLKSDIGYLP